VTYTVNGEQYVAVQVGWGGAFGIAGAIKPPLSAKYGRIMAFKLNAHVQLPPLPDPMAKYDPPPRTNASPETIKQGEMLFNTYCMGCHGMTLISMDTVPDLRFMHESRHAAFNDIVLHGAFKDRGMVGFAHVMDEQQADAVHAYIIDEANNEKERQQNPDPAWWAAIKKFFYELLGKFVRWVM
jgi:quinohemoprotein ethanol dehydrogenase